MKKTTIITLAIVLIAVISGSVAVVATADNFAENGWLFDSPDKVGLTDEEKSAIREELAAKEKAEKEAAKDNAYYAECPSMTEEEKEVLRRAAEYALEEARAWQNVVDNCVEIVNKYYPGQHKKPDVEIYNDDVFVKDLPMRELLLLCVANDKLTEEEQQYCAVGLYFHLLEATGEENDRIEKAIEPWMHPADEEEEPPVEEESSGYYG